VKKLGTIGLVISALASGATLAQTSVLVTPDEIKLRLRKDETKVGSKQESAGDSSASSVSADVEMTGVAVINGDVYIDGEKLPHGKRTFTSKKTGKNYVIEWGKNGNVSVAEK
jgi:hypothetical protein